MFYNNMLCRGLGIHTSLIKWIKLKTGTIKLLNYTYFGSDGHNVANKYVNAWPT